MRYVVFSLAALALAGCQGGLLSDTLKGPNQLATEDASYCQYAGLSPGTTAFANCMLYKNQIRETQHAEARSDLRQSLREIGETNRASPTYNSPPRITNCTTRQNGPYLNTTCF